MFLFLYSSRGQKAALLKCEDVFKAVLRKFRHSALFSYMEIDLSPSCRDLLSEKLKDAFRKSSGVLWCNDETSSFSLPGTYCVEMRTVGRSIFYAPAVQTAIIKDGDILSSSVVKVADIEKTVSFAAEKAKTRCLPLTICTDTKNESDRMFLKEAENFLGGTKHLSSRHISLNEFIHRSGTEVPLYDIVLATENTASIVSAHMRSLMNVPTGHTVLHTENGDVYLREIFPFENLGCSFLASLMLAFSGMLEAFPETKSGGVWLRKCVGIALERCQEKESFPQEVLLEIKKPIRNRQVKKDDSKN